MNPKTTRAVAKFIAILLVVALVVTSFSFVFFWAGTPAVVYAASSEEPDWNRELLRLRDFMIQTKGAYKDDVSFKMLIDGAYQGIIDSLGDPYSVYYSSENESKQFEESVSGEFFGVGVSLEQVGGICKVVAPISGTPADRAGVLSGDVVTQVDGQDVTGMTLEQIASRLRGEEGTKVTMTVQRDNRILTFSMIREKIKLASVDYRLLEDDIGYIKIAQFDSDVHLEFKNAKLKLLAAGAKSFIVDVRNNPGGYVGGALDIAEQLMPAGPIVHFEKQGKIVETFSANGTGNLGLPVVLLINEGSASASEILAAAWQDSNTATLVGMKTYGKGVAQQMIDTAGDGKLKLSMYYFLSPNKHPIDKVGVKPDYVVRNYSESDVSLAEQLYNEYKAFAPMAEKSKPKLGDTGLNVFGAQQRLSLLGYGLKISGTMDTETVAAVKAFQAEKGLFPYGVLDYSTMNALDKAALAYITGAAEQKDLQLEKAIELLKK
ncbi:MAG: S41 family peptidase [Anaerovoracaceae bacterium]|jgi:carboxyl-terminal processing protease